MSLIERLGKCDGWFSLVFYIHFGPNLLEECCRRLTVSLLVWHEFFLCQSLWEHSVLVRFTTWNYKLFLLLKENQHSGCLFVELTRIHFVPPFYRYYIYDIYKKKNPILTETNFDSKNKGVDILLFVLSTFIWNIVVVKHYFHSSPLQPSHFCGVWNFRDWLCG